jgi:nitrogen fixation NifU-like protein
MSLNYTKKTINHFLKPKNIGEMKNPDAKTEIGNMVCGDQLSFAIKVKDGRIADIKFLSFGCASNIATASLMTEKVKGMKLEDAKKFDWNEIVKDLGGLPRQKVHCSIMAVEGLRQVIAEYEKTHPQSGRPAPKKIIKKKAK